MPTLPALPPCSVGEGDEEDDDLSSNGIVRFCRSVMSFSDAYDGDNFFTVKVGGQCGRAGGRVGG